MCSSDLVEGVQVAEAMTDPGNLEGGGSVRRRFGPLGQGFYGLQSRTPSRKGAHGRRDQEASFDNDPPWKPTNGDGLDDPQFLYINHRHVVADAVGSEQLAFVRAEGELPDALTDQ